VRFNQNKDQVVEFVKTKIQAETSAANAKDQR
jgi:hypothetical protein